MGAPGLEVRNTDGAGVLGVSNQWGVIGDSEQGIGVVARSRDWPAVFAQATQGTGVWGAGENLGVLAAGGDRGEGVWGIAGGHGVRGTGTGIGVFGESSGGRGVVGRSTDANGVVGTSQNSNGILGTTADGLHAGVVGDGGGVGWGGFFSGLICDDPLIATGNVVVNGTTDLNSVNATGNVFVFGALEVFGLKLAVVPHPDGSYRGLYCMESPESWFEDFGTARVVRGKAMVKLDRNFVAVVRGEYHIFLAPEGESNGLYVSRKRRDGFEVREQGTGTSTLSFSYRVVARRRDVTVRRFEKRKPPVRAKAVSLPKGFPTRPISLEGLPQVTARPKLPPLPPLPEAPKRAARTSSRRPSRRKVRRAR